MKLIRFQIDRRPHNGYTDVHVNPEEVAAVYDNATSREYRNDNPTTILLKNGEAFAVMESVSVVTEKLNGGE